jgi:hypothetical protein
MLYREEGMCICTGILLKVWKRDFAFVMNVEMLNSWKYIMSVAS